MVTQEDKIGLIHESRAIAASLLLMLGTAGLVRFEVEHGDNLRVTAVIVLCPQLTA